MSKKGITIYNEDIIQAIRELQNNFVDSVMNSPVAIELYQYPEDEGEIERRISKESKMMLYKQLQNRLECSETVKLTPCPNDAIDIDNV